MAKFGVVVDDWMKANALAGSSVQCWTAMEEFFGVVPCTLMSMMSNSLMPSACETDMIGMIGMYVLQLAAGEPSAIVDWNNNYGEDPDKAVIFHCSNLPKHFFEDAQDGFPGNHRGLGGQGQHLRNRGRQTEGGPAHLLPRLHRRPARQAARLLRRGRNHRGQARRASAATGW